jgi:hypothetical protein
MDRSRRWRRRAAAHFIARAADSGGAAAADAMVALIILALTTVLTLTALDQAGRVATAALEVRHAQFLLEWLMESGPRSLTPAAGAADGFSWQVVTQLTGADQPISICRRAVSLVHQRSGRAYATATLVTCPAAGAT